MPSQAHRRDAVETALALLGVGSPEGALAYQPGQLLFDLLQSDEEFDELVIEVRGRSSNLREMLAALDAVQLAIDAATLTVQYHDQFEFSDDADVVRERLRAIEPDPEWELQIVELSAGSFYGTFKAFVRTPTRRKQILAVVALAGAVAMAIVPPAAPFIGIGVAAATGANVFIPEKPVKQVLQDQLANTHAAEAAEGQAIEEWQRTQRAVLDEGLNKMQVYMDEQLRLSQAREDAMRAEIETLKLTAQHSQPDQDH